MDVLDSCACSGGNLPRFVQPVLLALLAKESMHGYALVQKLEDTGLFSGQMPDVTGCYRMLREMEKTGVLETTPAKGDGPSRRKYAVTALGRRCLNRWISSLSGSRDHLDRVLALLVSARDSGGIDGSDCPEDDRIFMEGVNKSSLSWENHLSDD